MSRNTRYGLAAGFTALAIAGGLSCPWILAGCNQGDASHAELTGVQPDAKGVYRTNPFNLEREQSTPGSLEIAETTFNFGKMPVLEERSHAFVIRNNGDVPVRLALGPSTCQCTMGKLETDQLLPGEQTEVVLIWKPEAQAPEFQKGALIWTDIPEMSKIDFQVRGHVVPDVNIMPGPNWSTGVLTEGETSHLNGFVFSPLFADFEITKIEPSHDWLKVEYFPASPETLEGAMGEAGYEIHCDVLPGCPLGDFRGTLTVFTNLEAELYKEMTIVISGSRSGPFVITGRGWSGASYGTLELGDVSASEGKSVELSLTMEPGDEPLVLTPIESDPEILSFEMRRDENYPATNRERYYLTFVIPPNAPLGEWVGENAGVIKFHTNIPHREEMSIRVEFCVKDLD